MKLFLRDYLELPGPLQAVAALLHDPSSWSDACAVERTGVLWRYGNDLFALTQTNSEHSTSLRWLAACAAGIGKQLEVELTLVDAVIATHVDVRLTLTAPGLPVPWRTAAARRALQYALSEATARIRALLREREATVGRPIHAVAASVVTAPGSGALAGEPDFEPTNATPDQLALIDQLQERYPLTVEHFLAMGALEHLERVARLERDWERILSGVYQADLYEVVTARSPGKAGSAGMAGRHTSAQPGTPVRSDFDLIYAGGGLGLLHAAVMAACYGRRVMLFDRSEVGCAHREWNISRDELDALVGTGVVSWDELDPVVMRAYRDGIVRFYNRPGSATPATELHLPKVLDVALDAGALLRLMRRKLEAAGGVVLSGRAFRRVRVAGNGPLTVEVELTDLTTGDEERYTARLMLDGMGSTSPLALLRHRGRPFAGVCPTVGTVAAGFVEGDDPDEVDLSVGEILVTTADTQRGEQLMWEGFPGRDDTLTVYMFYYATVAADRAAGQRGLRPGSSRYSLLDLFEQYFLLLPTYKRPGPHFRHIKPVYGYIPGRHSLRANEAPLLRGILPVGDSAAQQSPLTFCGFGSHVRNLQRTTALLDYALRHELLAPEHLACVNAFQTNVSLHWVFSRFMHPWGNAGDVNRVQNIFLQVLEELGAEPALRFFRDRMRWSDYYPMLHSIRRRWPHVLAVSWQVLGPGGLVQWAGDYMRFTAAAMAAAAARLGGVGGEITLTRIADAAGPACGLRVRAWYEEWRAMGWTDFRPLR